ncbi:hypothetical protein DW020_09515 [Clostridium sp. AF37-5AT]|nr:MULTISPECIES: DUF3877 family protein [unclassified Clostridium]MBT9791279.1 hypothetical protein [Clostridium sp. MCC344]RHO40970.1 hypothetical protein DW181_01710 [Clostridium sp. AM16-23]RHO95091.1 hypothetical protein DW020_09515 [Clostridium sp. AF37-5AT]RHS68688.1 hypothetical protein DW954_00880 [Clostridium sp. AM45-5]RHW00790.1 hypothetical protein DXA91_03380 [Clostridium sp. OF09-10]
MGFHELEENLIDMVKEQQAKLGFRPEVIRLYYPVSTLNHFFGTDDTPERMEERLQELGVHTKDTLGAVQVTAKGDRFCIKIPEEGSVFVHEQMKGREFIQDLVELVGRHGCSLDEIRELFLKWSEHAVFEEIEDGDFDWAFHFADGIPDRYYYCFKDEGCHLIYHRFLPEDYEELL